MQVAKEDLFGKTFGYLTVMEYEGTSYDKSTHSIRGFWKCKCVCGNEISISRNDLIRGRRKSCGCMKWTIASASHKKHGFHNTRLYRILQGMKQRCHNPNDKYYHNYGERGISVCKEWRNKETGIYSFVEWALANGYADDLTIERIDVNGDYEPSNCCWIPRSEQPKNTRRSKRYTYNGMTKTLRDWGVYLGGSPCLVRDRLKKGWDIEKAITTPPIVANKEKT